MTEINWIIVKSKGRGTDYGVGTFVQNLIDGFCMVPNVDVFVLEIGSNITKEFSVAYQDGVTYFRFSQAWHLVEQDTVKNQDKYAKNIIRIIEPFIPKNRRNIIHLNFIFQYFIGKEFKKKMNFKVILTQHVFVKSQKEDDKFDLEEQTYRLVDQICTVTKHGKSHLVDKGVDADKINVIYNGINPDLFDVREKGDEVLKKYGLDEDVAFILYSGRLDPIKGLNYLATSFLFLLKEMPTLRLVFAGDGNYDMLIRYCRNFSANVCYLGFIPFEDLVVLYKKARIGVIPSLEEHCSYVALEMLHAGLPVVASNIGGLKEIFIHNENALLVDTIPDLTNNYGIAPQIQQFTNSMCKLLSNEHLREKFSANAVKRANEQFTSAQMSKKYVSISLNIK